MGWNGEKSAWLERKINESEWEKGGVWECWKLGGSFRLGWSYPLIVFLLFLFLLLPLPFLHGLEMCLEQ